MSELKPALSAARNLKYTGRKIGTPIFYDPEQRRRPLQRCLRLVVSSIPAAATITLNLSPQLNRRRPARNKPLTLGECGRWMGSQCGIESTAEDKPSGYGIVGIHGIMKS